MNAPQPGILLAIARCARYLTFSCASLATARDALEWRMRAERWNLVVRRSQEAVEIALKAVLRTTGIEVPRVHDVGVFLREHAERLPDPFAKQLDRVVSISRRLRQERETSFYGDEQLGAAPDELYVPRMVRPRCAMCASSSN